MRASFNCSFEAQLKSGAERLRFFLYAPTRVSRKNSGGMLRVLPPHHLNVYKYALGASAAARLAFLALFLRQVAKMEFCEVFACAKVKLLCSEVCAAHK